MPNRPPAIADPGATSPQPERASLARLGVYRLYCLITGLLLPGFWLAYRASDPGGYDPLWVRLLLSGLYAGLVAASYAFPAVRARMPELVHGLFYVVTVWFIGLAARNAFSPDYALGLLFVFAAVAVAFGTGERRRLNLAAYLALSLSLTAVALWYVPEAAIGRVLFGGCMLSMAVVAWVTTHSRARLEEALTASERSYEQEVGRLKAFYQQVLDDLPADVAVMDRDGRILYLNRRSVADPELRAYLIGRTGVDYCRERGLDPSLAERRLEHIRRAATEGGAVEFEETLRNRAGEQRHILRIASPIFDADGGVARVIGYGLDITEREQARQALKASEAQYRTLFDAAGDGILILRGEHFTNCNSRFLAMFGCDRDEIVGMQPQDLSPPRQPDGSDSARRALEYIIAAMEGTPQFFEWQCRRRDGTVFDAEVTLNRIDLDDQPVLQAIVRDVTQRRLYEQGLIEAKNRAEELLRVRTALLNNMSHEIRTPLTGIIGFSELLMLESDAQTRSFAGMIHSGGVRLLDTLNSVLDLAQLEAGTFDLHLEPVDVGAAIGDVARLLEPLAAQKGLAVRLELPASPVTALADRAALHRILLNLLSNAIKFTDAGHVTLRLRTDDGVEVAVADTGIGIAPAFLPHLFDEFEQESSGLARSHEGTGLGLAITKRLVELLGGQLRVASTKSVGSTFTFSLQAAVPLTVA